MAEKADNIKNALTILRKDKERKFSQTLDLVVNLENFDARKESVNIFVKLPNPLKKKVCGLLTRMLWNRWL